MKISKELIGTSIVIIFLGLSAGSVRAIEWRGSGDTVKKPTWFPSVASPAASSAQANPQQPGCEQPSDIDYVVQHQDRCIKEFNGVKVVNYNISYINQLAGTPMFFCTATMIMEGENGTRFDVTPFWHINKSMDLLCPLLQEAAISKTKLDVQVTQTSGGWNIFNASTAVENP